MKSEQIGTWDIETDPFEYGQVPRPFCCAFDDGKSVRTWWGRNCIKEAAKVMKRFHGYIYAHNGGNFDFVYFGEAVGFRKLCDPKTKEEGKPMMIKKRIASFAYGNAVFQDSYLLVPTALKAFAKQEIDYRKLHRTRRDKHRAEILDYLRSDVRNLRAYVLEAIEEYGFGLTLAGRAFSILKKRFGLAPPRTDENYDSSFREFYYGGRCQAFRLGEVPFPVRVFDINSAYPRAMMDEHPFGVANRFSIRLPKREKILQRSFVRFVGESDGALPVRTKQGIAFPEAKGEFKATGWELAKGLELKRVKVKKVLGVWTFPETVSFREFVNHYYQGRLEAKAAGDKVKDLLFKLVLNSLYGRFALNPRTFRDIQITAYDDNPGEGWEIVTEYPDSGFTIWGKKREVYGNAFFNVATAASITGWVRAYMLEALSLVRDPVYCDTDSIMARSMGRLRVGPGLGDWKDEGTLDPLWIAGKKLYAGQGRDGTWKTASKGVDLSWQQIRRVAQGATVTHRFDAPNLSLLSNVTWIERRIKRADLRVAV